MKCLLCAHVCAISFSRSSHCLSYSALCFDHGRAYAVAYWYISSFSHSVANPISHTVCKDVTFFYIFAHKSIFVSRELQSRCCGHFCCTTLTTTFALNSHPGELVSCSMSRAYPPRGAPVSSSVPLGCPRCTPQRLTAHTHFRRSKSLSPPS
jgi:hypothetical protein